jgi:hypothetical protein
LVSVYLNQTGFASNLVERFSMQDQHQLPTATPYQLGIPINSVSPSLEEDNASALKKREKAYQSLIGSIGWLAHTTHPDLTTVHSFLSLYTETSP